MKKEITVGQLVVAAFTLLTTIVTAWITLTNKVKELETRDAYRDRQIDIVNDRMEKIDEKTTQILVELQNKQNRK